MKKKILALLLAGTMVFTLAGCGSEPAEKAPAADGEAPVSQETDAPEEGAGEEAAAADDGEDRKSVV